MPQAPTSIFKLAFTLESRSHIQPTIPNCCIQNYDIKTNEEEEERTIATFA